MLDALAFDTIKSNVIVPSLCLVDFFLLSKSFQMSEHEINSLLPVCFHGYGNLCTLSTAIPWLAFVRVWYDGAKCGYNQGAINDIYIYSYIYIYISIYIYIYVYIYIYIIFYIYITYASTSDSLSTSISHLHKIMCNIFYWNAYLND